MKWLEFGADREGRGYPVVDERVMRGSAGILLALAVIAAINGFVLRRYAVLPYLTGLMALNFAIGLLINLRLAPSVALAALLVRKQSPQPIGAVQKRFAWTLGLLLSLTIFALSLLLQGDASWFNRVCELCLICIALLYLETAFGICVGCKLYTLALRLRLLKQPAVQPNCMGDVCEVEAR